MKRDAGAEARASSILRRCISSRRRTGTGIEPLMRLGRRAPTRAAMVEAADAEAHARARGRDRAPGAAARRHIPAQAALCAPGRQQSAAHHHPRHALDRVSDSYRRYLERFFRDAFELLGTPLQNRVPARA